MRSETDVPKKIRWPTLALGVLLAGAVYVFFAWVGSEVYEGEWSTFDASVRGWLHGVSSPGLTQAAIFASYLGAPVTLVVAGLIAEILLLYVKWRREAVFFLITMAGEVLLDLFLKGYYARVRPEPFFDYALPTSFSFPSGHAFGSLCFYGMLAWLISRRLENRPLAWALLIAALLLALCIGISRIYLGVHYPSDVVNGFLAGLIWLATVLVAGRLLKTRRFES